MTRSAGSRVTTGAFEHARRRIVLGPGTSKPSPRVRPRPNFRPTLRLAKLGVRRRIEPRVLCRRCTRSSAPRRRPWRSRGTACGRRSHPVETTSAIAMIWRDVAALAHLGRDLDTSKIEAGKDRSRSGDPRDGCDLTCAASRILVGGNGHLAACAMPTPSSPEIAAARRSGARDPADPSPMSSRHMRRMRSLNPAAVIQARACAEIQHGSLAVGKSPGITTPATEDPATTPVHSRMVTNHLQPALGEQASASPL